MLHSEIKIKIQNEIDTELGRDHLPSGNDIVRLPYTDAFLMEVQRIGAVSPVGISHRNIEDIEIEGMFLYLD